MVTMLQAVKPDIWGSTFSNSKVPLFVILSTHSDSESYPASYPGGTGGE